VLITTLASYCLFKLGAYHFSEAALLTKSPWLGTFAFAGWTPEFTPNIFKAIIQGITTFFSGDATYNSNLWTMRPEFLGSLVVFLLGALIVGIFSLQYVILLAPLFLVWALGSNVYFFPFILGLFLAAWMVSQSKTRTMGLAIALVFVAVGFYLLGYEIAAKDYAWTIFIKHPVLLVSNMKVVFHSVGAALIIYAVLLSPVFFQFLSGRAGFYLGKLSFPLYLVHTLVICSVSSYWFIRWEQSQSANFPILVATFVLTVIISILAAIPMIFLDGIWLKFINRWALSFFRRK
jgi:peptidoglycan/LPS O-acetylase OafA/YrhL